MEREPIYAALFTLVANSAEFATKERRLRHWNDVAPPEQPALFLAQKSESANPGEVVGAPTQWTLRAEIYLYAHSSDPRKSPSETMNPLVDAVVAALAPPAIGHGGRRVQTLGLPNVVAHCWIAGEIETDEGVLGDQAVTIIPVEILAVG